MDRNEPSNKNFYYERGPTSNHRDLDYSRQRRAVSASGSSDRMSDSTSSPPSLNRPSATSENYKGPSSNSKVSIHNMTERQSWEKRSDSKVRGYVVSRDTENERHYRRERGRDHYRSDYDRRSHRDYDRYYRRSRSPRHRSYSSRGRYDDDDDMSRSDRTYSSRDRDHRREDRHHSSCRYDHDDDRRSSYSRDGHYHDDHHHHRRSRHHDNDRRYHESSSRRSDHHRDYSRSRSRDDDHDGYHERSSSPGWETVPSRSRRSQPSTGYTIARTTKSEEVPTTPPFVPPNPLNTQFEKFVLVLVGVPGSGKSTFAKALETAMPYKYVRINQDELGNRRECEDKCRAVLKEGKCPVIDRCNFNPQQRKHFLNIASEQHVKVDAIVFTYPMEECLRRCQARNDHETIQPGEARSVLERMMRDFSPPLPNRVNLENFRNLRQITNVGEHNDLVLEYLSAALF